MYKTSVSIIIIISMSIGFVCLHVQILSYLLPYLFVYKYHCYSTNTISARFVINVVHQSSSGHKRPLAGDNGRNYNSPSKKTKSEKGMSYT